MNAFVAKPDAWWPEFGIALEVDSQEWHLSPHDHARTLERQRRMAKHGILILPFTPRQILGAEPDDSGVLPLAHAADQTRRVGPDGLEDLSLAAAMNHVDHGWSDDPEQNRRHA